MLFRVAFLTFNTFYLLFHVVISHKRIFQGDEAALDEIPYQALIYSYYVNDNNTIIGYRCGGVLVDDFWILTAAHCLYNSTTTEVYMGHVNVDEFTYKEYADKRVIHADTDGWVDDIAMLKLPADRPAKGENIRKIPLFAEKDLTIVGIQATISGFGVTRTGNYSDNLQKAIVTIVPIERCEKLYLHTSEKNLCAFGSGRGSCHGDSGGPVTVNIDGIRQLIGIIKGGLECGSENIPEIYVRVLPYKEWIEDVMADL